MAQARGTKKKTTLNNRRDRGYEQLERSVKSGRAYKYGGSNRSAGGHEDIESYKHNDSHMSRESARASQYLQEQRKAKKSSYNGHAAEGAGERGGNSQRGKYVPSHHKQNEVNLAKQRNKYGKGASKTINAPGGHEPVGTSNGRRKSSGVRDASGGLTAGDFRRAGQEVRKGARAFNEAVKKNFRGPTPSERPGETGREWGNHKYIDKVKTKSGKIRYIYDIDTSGGRKRDANDVYAERDKKRKENFKKNLKATEEGQRNRYKQDKHGNDFIGKARGKARAFLRRITG